ncbi:MAG TPA: hypothetical protein VJY47_00335 [Candidatus Dojkabacteria bacterium]|nr:hypothetical protein [Candidatus Dojkabacteria bacterium]
MKKVRNVVFVVMFLLTMLALSACSVEKSVNSTKLHSGEYLRFERSAPVKLEVKSEKGFVLLDSDLNEAYIAELDNGVYRLVFPSYLGKEIKVLHATEDVYFVLESTSPFQVKRVASDIYKVSCLLAVLAILLSITIMMVVDLNQKLNNK